jgi:long-subunit fatty acid transport protein
MYPYGTDEVDFNHINYFSFVYPFRRTLAGRNMVISLNYQREYDFDRDLDFRFRDTSVSNGALINVPGLGIIPIPGGIISTRSDRYHYRQRGSLSALSPAFGMELTDTLSVGVVMNIWDQSLIPSNQWKERTEIRAFGTANGPFNRASFVRTRIDEDYEDFEGTNWTLGLLYKPNDRWSLGAVYNTKLRADLTYSISQSVRVSGLTTRLGVRRKRDQEYTFPSSYGIGAAYRFPNDKLTLSFDVTRVEWGQFEFLDPENLNPWQRRINGISGLPQSVSPEPDPTYTLRLGMEYVFVNAKKPVQHLLPSLRAGIFYDPEPSVGYRDSIFGTPFRPFAGGDGKPVPYYGFALGAGLLVRDRINFDVAYMYRFGDDARKETFSLPGASAEVDQHTLYFSTVVYF